MATRIVVKRSPREWDRAAQVANAYQVGRVESSAALNLVKHVDPLTRIKLADLVGPSDCK